MTTHKAANNPAVKDGHTAEAKVFSDTQTVPVTLAAADIIRFGPFPGGVNPHRVTLINDDLDTHATTPTLAIKGGYTYQNGDAAPAGADTAFIATGNTSLQAASGVSGNQFAVAPFNINQEWFLDLVVTNVAATKAAGTVTAIVEAKAVGIK